MTRQEQVDLANAMGFVVVPDPNSIIFSTGGDRKAFVWIVRDGWRVADLLDGRYQNHRTLPTLREALENASGTARQ